MNDDSQPTTGELLQAIVALHAFTEAGLQRLDAKIDRVDKKLDSKIDGVDAKIDGFVAKIDGVDGKIDGLRYDMNKRFDYVFGELDQIKIELVGIKSRVSRLEPRPT